MDHLEKARELRASPDKHYNCCQSVLVAFAEDLGLTEDQAFSLGANVGSGMRCGSACGALTGGLMVLGMLGCDETRSTAFLRKFQQEHGAINCAELLKASHDRGVPWKVHCDGLVFEVVQSISNP